MILKGYVEDIVFRNDENGYTVLDVDVNGELVTCVGSISFIAIGEQVEFNGDYVKNNKYGKQFSIKDFKTLEPNSIDGILRYLGSGIIKGVGEATATRIVKEFGKDSLNIIEYNPRRLAEVKGISAEGALRIGSCFNEIKKMKNAIIFLQQYDVSINLAMKIFSIYKEKTEELVKLNPFKLVEDIDGIGFITADRIAKKMGIKEDSPFRIRAGVLHILKQLSEKSGSTFCFKQDLFKKICVLLEGSYFETFNQVMLDLKLDGAIKVFNAPNEENELKPAISLSLFYNTETSIASKLIMLNDSFENDKVDCLSEIKSFEKLNNITFHTKQIDAIKMALNCGISIITGGPGTGKTTIIKCITYILGLLHKKTMLLAPTGRASKRLSESTGLEAKTIHRGLEVEMKNGRPSFKFNENNKLKVDAIVVDEISMIDCVLMNSLLKAINVGTKLVLVGDKDQLPSVGAGNVLKDILESNVFNYINLTQIYRQDDKSIIVENAHKINNGEMPNLDNKSVDFFFEHHENPDDIASSIKDLVVKRLPKYAKVNSREIQVLAPLKIGKAGIDNLNEILQEEINPPKFGQKDIEFERATFRLNDKVMQTQNNYDAEWTKFENGITISGTGIFNGDIGTISKLNAELGEIEITFDDGRVANLTRPDLYEITLAYAITVHKSQGCEFDVVVIPITMGAPIIFTRNLLYTAITRAKKLVVLVGTKKAISYMVKNNYTERRNTNLKDFLTKKQKDFESLYEN